MIRSDYERLYHARVRWQKEQQLIRKKYQIPYKMTYTLKPCSVKSTFLTSPTRSVFNREQRTISRNNPKAKTAQLDKHHLDIENNESNILPVHCLKCCLNPTKCSCSDGLGEWWRNLQKKYHAADQESQKSSVNSPQEKHLSFNSSQADLSLVEQTKARLKQSKHQYVLLDWNSRPSLLNFLRTTKHSTNLSKMTIEQLQDYIIDRDHISIFNSITDLILSLAKEKQQPSLCQIYIDPSYHLNKQETSPLSSSKIMADNLNLNRTMRSIQNLAALLGVKLSQSLDEFSSEKITRKQRKSILNQQALLIASNIPYNTCHSISLYTA